MKTIKAIKVMDAEIKFQRHEVLSNLKKLKNYLVSIIHTNEWKEFGEEALNIKADIDKLLKKLELSKN